MKLSVNAALAAVAVVALSGAATAKNLRVGNNGDAALREAYRGYLGEYEAEATFVSWGLPGDREESDDDPHKGDYAGVLDERELRSSDAEELDYGFDGGTEEEEGDDEGPDLPDGRELGHKKKRKHGHKKKKKHGHKKKKKHCYTKCRHGRCKRYCK